MIVTNISTEQTMASISAITIQLTVPELLSLRELLGRLPTTDPVFPILQAAETVILNAIQTFQGR